MYLDQRLVALVCCIHVWISNVVGETFYCHENGEVNTIRDLSGTIKTVYTNSQYYEKNQHCSWVINAGSNNNTKIQLRIIESGLEWAPEGAICNGYDFVEIRNGDNQWEELELSWCGEQNPYHIITKAPLVYISFRSNDRHTSGKRGVTMDFNTFTLSSNANSCPDGWHEFESSCYSLEEHEKTWLSALEHCHYQQANLVSFQNDREADFVSDLVKKVVPERTVEYYWIGLSDIGTEGTYQWIDHITSQVTDRWISKPHEPDRYFDCIALRSSDGKWKEEFCTESEVRTLKKYKFVCKRSMDKETKVYSAPEEKIDEEGEGKLAAGKKYIIAGIICGAILIIIIAIAIYSYVRFGDQVKEKYRNHKRHVQDRRSESESVPLPPYNPAHSGGVPPPRQPSPPPPYSPVDSLAHV